MGFQFHRKLSLGKGGSMSLSRSGVSLSQRTTWGSFGTGGFGIKTGIPGLSYRKRYKKGGPAAIIASLLMIALPLIGILLQMIIAVAIYVTRIILIASLWIIFISWELIKWSTLTTIDFAKHCYCKWRTRKLAKQRLEQLASTTTETKQS